MNGRIRSCIIALGLLASLPGCSSDGPQVVDVSGTVTLDGKPVPAAVLTFIPQVPDGSPSYGRTDADGKYTLAFTRSKSGAMLGQHVVEIETQKLSADEVADLKAEGQEPPAYVAIPKKYRAKGGLTAEVKSGGNQLDFKLTSD